MYKSVTRRGFLQLCILAAGVLPACARSDGMRRKTAPYAYRFADATEGAQLLLSNESYHEHFSQLDIDFRLQRKGGTLEEMRAFAAEQVLDFTDEEKALVGTIMAELEDSFAEHNLALPASEEIVFVKTTMREECDAGAYTHGTQIYLGEYLLEYFLGDEVEEGFPETLIAHELFHCLTHSNPTFRADMYSVLGFEVQDTDFALGPAVLDAMISNPDVEHHDSSAEFLIDGQTRRCTVVFYAVEPFEKEGDNFFDLGSTGLVPLDDLDTIIPFSEAENFSDLFGENTDYVIDPEECLADNFSYAIVFGQDGTEYETPRIIEEILAKLAG